MRQESFRDIYYAKYYGKGGGEWPAGEKIKLGVTGKNEKGERKLRPSRRKLICQGKKMNLKKGRGEK